MAIYKNCMPTNNQLQLLPTLLLKINKPPTDTNNNRPTSAISDGHTNTKLSLASNNHTNMSPALLHSTPTPPTTDTNISPKNSNNSTNRILSTSTPDC